MCVRIWRVLARLLFRLYEVEWCSRLDDRFQSEDIRAAASEDEEDDADGVEGWHYSGEGSIEGYHGLMILALCVLSCHNIRMPKSIVHRRPLLQDEGSA